MDSLVRGICHELAGNDKTVRRRALKNVKSLFNNHFQLDDMSLNKLCKGLYYFLWMTDNPIETRKVSVDIIQLYKEIKLSQPSKNGCDDQIQLDQPEIDERLRFFKFLIDSISREWLLLDKNRVDKVMLFVRIYISEVLFYMQDLKWDLLVLNKLGEIFINKNIFGRNSLGLLIHIIQVFLTELINNHDSLNDVTSYENGKTPTNSPVRPSSNELKTNSQIDLSNRIDSVKLLYILKPFIIMFVNSKDKLVLKTIQEYILKKLDDLTKITSITPVVHLLNTLLNSKSETGPGKETQILQGFNKRYMKSSLKLYETHLKENLTQTEKFHLDQLLCSIYSIATVNNEQDSSPPEPLNRNFFFYNRNADGLEFNEPLGTEYLFSADHYLDLGNVITSRMTKRRLRILHILNCTKNHLLKEKADDEDSIEFLNMVKSPEVQNQLFYYSLVRLRRLKLQYRFKSDQLDRIYNISKSLRSNFNINLKQALDNIKNVKPTKSSLLAPNNGDKRKKRLI